MNKTIVTSRRIWLNENDLAPDSYVRLRRKFQLDAIPRQAILSLAADTEFALYVNGNRIPATQFPDYPTHKTYSVIDIASALQVGQNVIAILIHHFGYGNATHRLCRAGLRFSLEIDGMEPILSDNQWLASPSEAYCSGNHQLMSIPVGFRFEYDSRKEEDWQSIAFDDHAWSKAVELPCPDQDGHWQHLSERPVPFLLESEPIPVNLIWQGEILQLSNQQEGLPADSEKAPPFLRHKLPENAFADWREGWNCQREDSSPYPYPLTFSGSPLTLLPPSLAATGLSVIIDLEQETVGFPVLEIEVADTDELTIEIHHGEHLDDLQVRSRILYARYIDTYHAAGGRHFFKHPLRRLAGRYLQLFISGRINHPVKLFYAGLSETTLPLSECRPFESDYALQSPVRELAIRTLISCMHDHYEDCPWREQSLYAYDSRNQILYGYYLWGNYDFVQASLDLLAGGYFREIGYLALCAPSQDILTIPAFTYVWIVEVEEFVLFSGRTEFFHKHRALIDDILEKSLSRRDPDFPGLFLPGEEKNLWSPGISPESGRTIWNFYEWCGELATDTQHPQALYQCYLAEALLAAAKLHDWIDDGETAERYRHEANQIAAALNHYFWSDEAGCYCEFIPSRRMNQQHYEHLQVMMLYLEMVPSERKSLLIDKILSGKLAPCTYSSMLYFLRAMIRETPETQLLAEKRLREAFEPMLLKGSTTLWELPNGGNAGHFGGSLCHGWSAIPAYFAGACNLGVRPLKPGFAEFSVTPVPGTLKRASGRVPTPAGDIAVDWHLDDQGELSLTVTHPETLHFNNKAKG